MELKTLSLENEEETRFLETLYLEAFPPFERRPVSTMRERYANDRRFTIYIIYDDRVRIGFINLWALSRFLFVDHFAIARAMRGKGAGGSALTKILETRTQPLVFEVEPENASETAKRRVAFYARHGFRPVPLPYEQPSFAEGPAFVPMTLMTTNDIDLTADFERAKKEIYHVVYEKRL